MIKEIKKSFLIFMCLVVAFCGASAAVINQDGVPIKTNTDIVTNGNITNITTNTTIKDGSIGVNTFGKFNVDKGDIVNLNLINGQNKLVNLIYDSSPSQINGIINSYMNGKIGGNVLFANPNGFVIGADGVFNVGSLTLITPTQQSMQSFVNAAIDGNPATLNETQINKLISFSFNGDNYLVCGDTTDPIKLAPSLIEVNGKINSANGIDLISGGSVKVKTGAQLNANVEFQYDENNFYDSVYQVGDEEKSEQLSIVKSTSSKSGVTPSSPSTFAMSDGNGVVIVASNNGESASFLGAIVNLNGNITANGSNVIVRTEIDNAVSGATSQIDMSATLSAKELTLSALNGSITSSGSDFTTDSVSLLAGDSIELVNTGDVNISSILSENNKLTLTSNQGSIKTVGTDYVLKAHDITLNAEKGAVNISNIETDSLTISSKTADIKSLNVDNTTITTSGLTKLGTATVDSLTLNAGSAEITTLTSGVTSITTDGLTKLGTTATVDSLDLTAGTAEIAKLVSTGEAVIKTVNGKTTITDANVGSLMLNADSTEITTLTSGVTSITTKGGLTKLGTATVDSLTLNAGSAEITTLTSGVTTITTDGLTTLGTATVDSLDLTAGTAEIAKLVSTGKADIKTVNGKTTITDANVGSLMLNADSTEITTLTSGVTSITTKGGLTKLGTATVDSLTLNAGSAEITTLTSGVTTITTDGLATIDKATVDNIILTSGSVNVTTSLTTTVGSADITAKTGDMTIATLKTETNAILKSNAGAINVTSATVGKDATLTSEKNNIVLGETTVAGALTAKAEKDLTINGDTHITGVTTLSAGNNIIFENTQNVVFNNDLIIKDTGAVDLESLTVNGKADITAHTIDIGTFVVNKDSEGKRGNATITSDGVTTIANATIANNLTTKASNLNITDKLTVGGTANLGSDNNIYVKDANINILDTKGATNVTIDNLVVTQTASLVASKDITLGTSNIGDKTEIISTGGNVSLGETTVKGTLTAKAKNDLTINDVTNVSGKTTLSAGDNLVFAKSKQVTFDHDLEIIETGHVNLDSLTVKGDLTTDAKDIKINKELVVEGTANLGSKENIYIKEAHINILDTKNATNITIEDLTVDNDAYLQANGNVVFGLEGSSGDSFGTTKIGGDLTIESQKDVILQGDTNVTGHTSLKAEGTLTFIPDDVTFTTLTIEEGTGNVNIENLNITEWADINCDGKTTIQNANIEGDLTTNTRDLEITNLTVTGKTLLRSDYMITLHNADLADLTTKANNMTVDYMEVDDVININNSGNLKIVDMLAHEVSNIRSEVSIDIVDATMEKDLNINSKNANIQEITLDANLNGNVDKLTVNTTKTEELKIGYIQGKSKSYATSTKITTPNTVVNGLGDEYSTKDINIYGKNITIDATTQIASPDKQLNFKLAKDNNIRLYSDGTIDVFSTGSIGNYRDIVTDNLNIKTDSDGINIYRAIVTTYGDIRLAGKHIIIDNTTWAPDLYVTLQLRSITSPHYLFVNGSPFITTQSLNALRHGINIYVNRTKDATSMNSWLTSSMEAQLKTSNVAEKFYDKTDKNLNTWATLDSYIVDNFADNTAESIVRTVKGEIITPNNVDELINSNPNSIKKRRRFFRRKQQQPIEISCR